MQIQSIDLGQRHKRSSKEKGQSFQQMMQEQLDTHMQNKIKNLDPQLILCTKINTKQVINVMAKTIKLLEENIEGKFRDTGFGSDFWDMTPKAQATKEKIDKLDYIKS